MTAFEFDPETFDEAEVLRNVASDDIGTRAEAIYLLARKAFNDNNASKCISMLETALELFESINRIDGQRQCLDGLSLVATWENRTKQAEVWLQKLAKLDSEDLNTSGEVVALWNLGHNYRKLKDWHSAAATFAQAAAIARENSHHLLPNILAMLGRSLRKLGRYRESAETFAEAGELFKDSDESMLPQAENDQALSLLKIGEFQKALDFATEALELAKFDGNVSMQGKFEYTIAVALNGLGRHKDALEHLDEIQDRNRAKRRKHKMKIDLERVRALRGLNRGAEAKELLPGILAVCKRYKLSDFLCEAQIAMAELLMDEGQFLDAIPHLHGALEYCRDNRYRELPVRVHFLLAICFDLTEQQAERIAQLEAIAGNPLNIDTEGYPLAVADLALLNAEHGDAAVARSYIDAIGALASPTPYVLGRRFEAQGILLLKEGADTKAHNLFIKALRAYTQGCNTEDASNVAKRLPPVAP